jgi:ribulose-5-phosphate 4-epimerase/fuculose-1-phosphate aldolase
MDQGRDLAIGLGANTIALMRGHGCVVAGQTLKEAVAVAVFAQLNATMLLQAHQLGTEITYLSDGEVAEGMKMLRSSVMSMERAWEYFSERADLGGI